MCGRFEKYGAAGNPGAAEKTAARKIQGCGRRVWRTDNYGNRCCRH
ncbi:hypothetical protein BRYFOR_06614 [Marvinbryantia formatexigens DSM 14469]|uniref:Uncharacterized protein n=1 Tax=Marvinbryantia formatexigens DSM 14469 TaxID=478749 RepID=C6LDK5_9FIRM|nr:hypothetical protein BRYFOR_06614 [Marvinbryantia formatexigens DSM 14469]